MTRARVFLTAAALTSAAPALSHAQCDTWQFFSTPHPGDQANLLFGVSGLGPDDVWAVGQHQLQSADFGEPTLRTLALHWDGAAWALVPSPNPSRTFNYNDLRGVVPFSRDLVYAAGIYNPETGGAAQTLFMRYDGSDWKVLSSPVWEGGSAFWGLGPVAGKVGELWGVGGRTEGLPGPFEVPIAARFDGSGWSETDSEWVGSYRTRFYAVKSLSPDIAFAVGTWGEHRGDFRNLVEQWDGHRWTAVVTDTPGAIDQLLGVDAVSPTDVWAAGYWYDMSGPGTQPLIYHFDGSSWNRIELETFPEGAAELRSIAARSATEVYAAGTYAAAGGVPRPFILKFDGDTWKRMEVAPVGGGYEWFRALAVVPDASGNPGDVWTAGQYYDSAADVTGALTERLSPCTESCRPDCNKDGKLNINDFICFQSEWRKKTAYGDYNADGKWNINDFIAFQAAFSKGCL